MTSGGPWVALRFAAVGLVNTGVGLVVILVLQGAWRWHPFAANAAGYLIGGLISYLLNRRFTFRSRRVHGQALPRFVFAMLICFGMNLMVLHVALNVFGLIDMLAQGLAVLAYTLLFFVACRVWVFAPEGSDRFRSLHRNSL